MFADDLLRLLGLGLETVPVQECLAQVARGMQPDLDEDDPDNYADWVTINELGLEFGFEDEAYLRAWSMEKRRAGRLLLSQLYFYGETDQTRAYPDALPFGLDFADDRTAVRAKLGAHEATRRSYLRDFWRLPGFDLTIAYTDDGLLESLFCYLPYSPWPPLAGRAVPAFTPEQFVDMFGLRWSSAALRGALGVFDYERHLADVRCDLTVDLLLSDGLELAFAESSALPQADQAFPRSLAFAAVTFFAAREQDARQWQGPLPFGMVFEDSQATLMAKVGSAPAEHIDELFTGRAVWHFQRFSLSVLYSNLENRLLRVSMMARRF
jgi:hypothetical protein